jgi:hypothetical protein
VLLLNRTCGLGDDARHALAGRVKGDKPDDFMRLAQGVVIEAAVLNVVYQLHILIASISHTFASSQ